MSKTPRKHGSHRDDDLHQPKHDSLKKGLQITADVNDKMDVNDVATYLINDTVFSGKDLPETVIGKALEFDGNMTAFGKLANLGNCFLNLRRRLTPRVPPECADNVTSQLIDANPGSREDAVLQKGSLH
jgi:hypothetical protein